MDVVGMFVLEGKRQAKGTNRSITAIHATIMDKAHFCALDMFLGMK
jgi:hypothetical protein